MKSLIGFVLLVVFVAVVVDGVQVTKVAPARGKCAESDVKVGSKVVFSWRECAP